jgi:hypothetical protein
MTDDRFTTTVELWDGAENGTKITLAGEDESFMDYTCAPGFEIHVEIQRPEGLLIRVSQCVDEAGALALIEAIRATLERSKASAAERGHYEWIAAGRPRGDEPWQ